MKKIIVSSSIALLLLCSCGKHEKPVADCNGTLSLSGLVLEYDEETRASAASGNYSIFIRNEEGDLVKSTYYSEVKNNGSITLPAGAYTLEARSTEEEVPTAEFDHPVYGVSESFNIVAGQTTALGQLTCTLVQCKVTVSYDDAFLAMVSGEGKATVSVDPTAPLDFEVSYSDGKASYDQRAGYFVVNNGSNTTMTVVFSGKVDGKTQKMSTTLVGIQPRQWRQVKFIKKVNAQGNASFAIVINDYINDEELTVDLNVVQESVIGDDPDAPKGDGGITLEFAPDCTMYDDLMNIVVPASGTMDLRFVASVPNGVKKFIVDISSTNDSFIAAVNAAGGTRLDLVNPAADSEVIFQIVPFKHGSELVGMTSVDFDLGAAQEAIIAFPGEHTFVMDITDQKGCRNQIPVKLIVR